MGTPGLVRAFRALGRSDPTGFGTDPHPEESPSVDWWGMNLGEREASAVWLGPTPRSPEGPRLEGWREMKGGPSPSSLAGGSTLAGGAGGPLTDRVSGSLTRVDTGGGGLSCRSPREGEREKGKRGLGWNHPQPSSGPVTRSGLESCVCGRVRHPHPRPPSTRTGGGTLFGPWSESTPDQGETDSVWGRGPWKT